MNGLSLFTERHRLCFRIYAAVPGAIGEWRNPICVNGPGSIGYQAGFYQIESVAIWFEL
jgi:hypothetical protein